MSGSGEVAARIAETLKQRDQLTSKRVISLGRNQHEKLRVGQGYTAAASFATNEVAGSNEIIFHR